MSFLSFPVKPDEKCGEILGFSFTSPLPGSEVEVGPLGRSYRKAHCTGHLKKIYNILQSL